MDALRHAVFLYLASKEKSPWVHAHDFSAIARYWLPYMSPKVLGLRYRLGQEFLGELTI